MRNHESIVLLLVVGGSDVFLVVPAVLDDDVMMQCGGRSGAGCFHVRDFRFLMDMTQSDCVHFPYHELFLHIFPFLPFSHFLCDTRLPQAYAQNL